MGSQQKYEKKLKQLQKALIVHAKDEEDLTSAMNKFCRLTNSELQIWKVSVSSMLIRR